MICLYIKSRLFCHYYWNIWLPSCFLFRGMVRNGIPRICIYFGPTERNSELCSLPQKGSEQNYGSLLLFLFHGTNFRVVFSSAEGFGTEFRDFLFRGTTGIPSEITICSVYSVFRGIIFLSEIPNPSPGSQGTSCPCSLFMIRVEVPGSSFMLCLGPGLLRCCTWQGPMQKSRMQATHSRWIYCCTKSTFPTSYVDWDYEFKTPIVKRSLSLAIFISTS